MKVYYDDDADLGIISAKTVAGDRKSTRLNFQSHSDLVCRLLLEKKKE